jgi:HK97 family phage major capsid protein
MLIGLDRCLEDQILNGNGTDENLLGLNSTSGIQTQAAPGTNEDVFTVTRRAISKLELQGLDGTAFVMHPIDWENVELLRDDIGRFLGTTPGQSLPVDSAARRLFGRQVG